MYFLYICTLLCYNAVKSFFKCNGINSSLGKTVTNQNSKERLDTINNKSCSS
jgi:hypothetical protein